MRTHRVIIYYCPRCDRRFANPKSNTIAQTVMEAHVKKAHPDYYKMYEEEDE